MDKRCLHKISYGLYIVSSKSGEKLNGQIVNTVFQITSDPPTIAVSINKQNLTHEYIEESKIFTVSVLSQETPLKFIGQFGFKSGRDVDKFKQTKLTSIKANRLIKTPLISECIGNLEIILRDICEFGDHKLFVGEIIYAQVEEGLFNQTWNVDKTRLIYHLGGSLFTSSNKIIQV